MMQKIAASALLNSIFSRASGYNLTTHRTSTYFVNKARTFEWFKNDDSALRAEFKRGSFVVFCDKKPLLCKSENSASYSLAVIPHDKLCRLANERGFTVDPDSTALVDAVPMQNSTNDIDEEFLPIFTIGFGSKSSKLKLPFNEEQFQSELGGEFVDLRRAIFLITDRSSTHLMAKAQSLLRWTKTYKYCPKCASPLTMKVSKAFAVCGGCSNNFHPMISPVAITLVTDEKKENALLVRQPHHPSRLFTAIAGFSEIGETLEDTVRREIAEEVGIEVTTIQYANVSQPWPFPHMSLMCGFFATVHGRPEPAVDKSELEDAQWFSKTQVLAAFQNTATLAAVLEKVPVEKVTDETFAFVPAAGVLAHELIKRWLLEPSGSKL